MKVREIERLLKEAGKITVPQHKGDLNIKTANAILKQAGFK